MLNSAITSGDAPLVKLLLQGEDAERYSQEVKHGDYAQLAVRQITNPTINYNKRLLSVTHCYDLKILFDQFGIPEEIQSMIVSSYFAFDVMPYLNILRLLTRPSAFPDEDLWETTTIRCCDRRSTEIARPPECMTPLFECTFTPVVMREIIVIGYKLSDRPEGLYPYELSHLLSSIAFFENRSWMLFAACLRNQLIPQGIKEECEGTAKDLNDATPTNLAMTALASFAKPILLTVAASIASITFYFCLSDSNKEKIFSTIFDALTLGLGYGANASCRTT